MNIRYGKWFKTRIFGKVNVFVPSTNGARTIFTNDFVQFNKGLVKSMADVSGKRSLFSVPHEDHKRMRRLFSEPFSVNSLFKFVQMFDKMVLERLRKHDDGKSFGLLDFTMKVTFDAMCDMLMSIQDPFFLQQFGRHCADITDAMLSFPIMIPGSRYYKGIKAREKLMEKFGEIIKQRRVAEEPPQDFLQFMLQRDSYPDNEKLDDEEIMDNLLTMILAGQTSPAAAMMWSVKFLHDNREVQDRLREEQLSIARNKPNGHLLTLEDLNNMPYAKKVVQETLRMSNPVLWIPRVVKEDCKIDGHEIKKGWHVNVDATCIHYDPEIYNDPMQFNPSRFGDMQQPYTYLPFGLGPRTCLGINMANQIMLVFLHRLTSEYRWTVDDQDPRLERKSHVPRLRSGCPITLKALENSEHTAN